MTTYTHYATLLEAASALRTRKVSAVELTRALLDRCDTGGSIRFPSAANGITGLKPTWGRVGRHGVFALADSLDHIGPMRAPQPTPARYSA